MSRLSFDFGLLGAGTRRSADRESTRILVIADLRGSAKAQGGLDAAGIVALSVDSFEDVMRRVQPRASLLAAGAQRTLTFESMHDFHPDELYTGVELFARTGGSAPARITETDANEDDAATLERLLGRPATKPATVPALPPEPRSVLDQMLRDIVAPHIVRPSVQPAAASAAATDIGSVMREVLHAPEFQAAEATWRALRWLVHENPLGTALEVDVLDASREDLVADLRACSGELERSQLYRAIVPRTSGPGARPYALVVGDYTFAGSEEDVSLLAGLGAVAAQAGGCFLGAAEPRLWGCTDLARQPDRGDWVAPDREFAARVALLRGSAVAPFVGLCAPRVLGRVPYGKRSDPIDRFDFTELAADPSHREFLWINGAFACAQLILAALAHEREPGSVLDLRDLPHAVYRFAGGDAIKPCAEVYLDETSAARILESGVMPLMSHRDRNAVRLLRLQSIASPPAALAVNRSPYFTRP